MIGVFAEVTEIHRRIYTEDELAPPEIRIDRPQFFE